MFKLNRFSEARLNNAQEAVLDGYKRRFRLTRKEAGALHMFFSPYRVAKGLTKQEVKLIIEIYPLLGSYRRSAIGSAERFLNVDEAQFSGSVTHTVIPVELTSGGRMTRRNFREGMRKLLHILT